METEELRDKYAVDKHFYLYRERSWTGHYRGRNAPRAKGVEREWSIIRVTAVSRDRFEYVTVQVTKCVDKIPGAVLRDRAGRCGGMTFEWAEKLTAMKQLEPHDSEVFDKTIELGR